MRRSRVAALLPPLILLSAAFAGCLQEPLAAADAAAPAASGEDACDASAAAIRERLAQHEEDPFGERPPVEPSLVDCTSAGTFQLAAYGLEGADALRLSWRFPEDRTCDYDRATAGPSPRSSLTAWEAPDGTLSAGMGWSGTIARASAGPFDTTDVDPSGGRGANGGGGSGQLFAAGDHHLYLASNQWGAMDTGLTDGAALLLLMACDGPFEFLGLAGAETLHYFDRHDGHAAAGVTASRLGAGAGRAIDTALPEGGDVVFAAFSFAGAAGLQVEHGGGATRTAVPPMTLVALREEVAPGSVAVTVAGAGAVSAWVGFAVSPWEPRDPSSILEA